MRKYTVMLIVLSFGAVLYGQQIPPLSQYIYNHYSINPAATGITDDLPLSFTYRKMWAGISGSPSIQYLSGHMKHGTCGHKKKRLIQDMAEDMRNNTI